MLISSNLPVVAHAAGTRSQSLVARQNNPAISKRTEVLRWIETRTPNRAYGAGWATVTFSAERLRAVLDDLHRVVTCKLVKAGWVHGMPVQMHRHHRSNAVVGSKGLVRLVEIEPATWIDVTPDWLRSGPNDRESRREGCQRGRENPSAGGQLGAAKSDLKRVQPAGDANRMRDAPPLRQFLLEFTYLLTEDQPAAFSDAIDSADRVIPDVTPLAREVVAANLKP
jgi:hypothetical protein